MNLIPVIRKINNREIISKIMDSVAKTCDCRVRYSAQGDCLQFTGDTDCINYIARQTAAFFGVDYA